MKTETQRTIPEAGTSQFLDGISNGTISAREAWANISKTIKLNDKESSSKAAKLYDAMFDLAIKDLAGRGQNEDAKYWYDISKRVAAALSNRDQKRLAGSFDSLCHIFRQIDNAPRIQPDLSDLLERNHVQDVLCCVVKMRDAKTGTAAREAVAEQLRLKPANLSRVLAMMQDGQIIYRVKAGRNASFALTDLGERIAKEHFPKWFEENSDKESLVGALQNVLMIPLFGRLEDMIAALSTARSSLDALKVSFAEESELAWDSIRKVLTIRTIDCLRDLGAKNIPWMHLADLHGIKHKSSSAPKRFEVGENLSGARISSFVWIEEADEDHATVGYEPSSDILNRMPYDSLGEYQTLDLVISSQRDEPENLLTTYDWRTTKNTPDIFGQVERNPDITILPTMHYMGHRALLDPEYKHAPFGFMQRGYLPTVHVSTYSTFIQSEQFVAIDSLQNVAKSIWERIRQRRQRSYFLHPATGLQEAPDVVYDQDSTLYIVGTIKNGFEKSGSS